MIRGSGSLPRLIGNLVGHSGLFQLLSPTRASSGAQAPRVRRPQGHTRLAYVGLVLRA